MRTPGDAADHHAECDVHVYGLEAICMCDALELRDRLAEYHSGGQCDRCTARPGELVNHLVPCACWSKIGAAAEVCECPWGAIERKKARRAAEKAADTPQPLQVSSRRSEGTAVSVGVGRVKAPEGARLVKDDTGHE